MVTHFRVPLGRLLMWLPRAAGVLYAGMVLLRYRTDGTRCRPGFRLREPARSVRRIVVWLGVKVVAGFLAIATALLGVLLEASADVGEWYLRRRPDMQESIRSRFPV